MNENQAIEEAQRLLQADITVSTGQSLKKLEPHISADKFGNLWEALVAAAPIEVVMELDEN